MSFSEQPPRKFGPAASDKEIADERPTIQAIILGLLEKNYPRLPDDKQQLSEDIAQEAILKAIAAKDSYRGDSAFKTWLTGVAINVMRDKIKSLNVRRKHEFVLDKADDASAQTDLEQARAQNLVASSPHTAIDSRRRSEQLRKLIAELSPVQKKYMTMSLGLHDGIDRTNQEIADELGVPLASVSSMMFTARKNLRKMAGDSGFSLDNFFEADSEETA